MTRGRSWTLEQEAELRALIEAKTPLKVAAAKLGKTAAATFVKAQRMGLHLEGGYTTHALPVPRELPSIEEALIKLAGALKAAAKPGLEKVEVQRLQVVATLAKTYKELLADYISYREIEAKLAQVQEENAKLLQELRKNKEAPNPAPQPDTAPVV